MYWATTFALFGVIRYVMTRSFPFRTFAGPLIFLSPSMPSSPLPQITRVAKRITSRLRPDRETMRLFPHGDAFHFACRCVDRIDHVVKASRKPQHLPVGAHIPHIGTTPAGNRPRC